MAVKFIEPLNYESFKDVKLYKIFSLDRILEMFDQRKFTFLSPSKWEDPYEKGFLTMNITNHGTPMILPTVPKVNPVKFSLFAQCWTTIQESEALWRIRSPHNDGVNISVQAKIIFDFLNRLPYDIYIGKVSYPTVKELFDPNKIRNELTFAKNDPLIFHLRLLLRKRRHFQYETEYRFFLISKQPIGDEFLDIFDFDPCQIIHGLMLHPNIGNNLELHLTTYFKNTCKSKIRINKSKFAAPLPPVSIAI